MHRLATDTNPDKDIQIDLKYLQQLWTYLTPAGTDVGREAARFASLGPDGGYLAPIKPWLCRLLGSSLLFRSRIAAAKPCLHTELMFVGDVMNMHLITDLVCSSGSRSCEPSPEQERVLLLMAELAKQDPKGPWGEARAMCKDPLFMQAFSACISHLHLFIPNQLLLSHNLQVRDSDVPILHCRPEYVQHVSGLLFVCMVVVDWLDCTAVMVWQATADCDGSVLTVRVSKGQRRLRQLTHSCLIAY